MPSVPVSVVIPSYNSGRLVTEAVDSVLAQTVSAAEIVVVDDGSTDDTADRLARYGGRVKYVRQENRGVSAARNRGVAEAGGELIAFLDADDVWHPRKLAVQTDVLARLPEVGAVSTRRYDWPLEAAPELPAADPLELLTPIPWAQLALRNFLDTSSIVVRRSVLEAVGPFDTQLQGPEDHDLWLRIAEVTTFAHLGLPLTGYRQVPGSLSKQADRMRRDKYKMMHKQLGRSAWKGRFVLRRKALSLVEYSCYHMYGEAGRYGSAILSLVRSLAWYPLPFSRAELPTPFARPKGMILSALRWAGLRRVPG